MTTSRRLIPSMALICLMGVSRGAPMAAAHTSWGPPADPDASFNSIGFQFPSVMADGTSVAQSQPPADAARGRFSGPHNVQLLDWPSPVHDRRPFALVLFDVFEFRPHEGDGDYVWDIDGWFGGDYNRLWFKTEGGANAAFKTDYDIDAQLLYGRFVAKYYDFQVGGRVQTKTVDKRNVTRGFAVIGIEGLVPYNYEAESALFISQAGDVSARLTLTKDLLLTQRLILQARFEADAAIQEVERFTVGSGLNSIEAGLRLRYEIWREFAPYIGISYDRSVFGTADLVRRDGGDPSDLRFVVGLRMWF